MLYTFIDTGYLHGRDPADVARALCDGGSDLIQLRAKDKSVEEVRRLASAVFRITSEAKVPLVINDHPAIAAEIGAQFCHLGQGDFFDSGHTHIDQLPALMRPLKIGLSTHTPDQARRAIAAGPAYVAIGPVYATGTKPNAQPVTLDYVRWAASQVEILWFAIGGITLQNLPEVVSAGARNLCVVSAILNSKNITEACQEFKNSLISAVRERPVNRSKHRNS